MPACRDEQLALVVGQLVKVYIARFRGSDRRRQSAMFVDHGSRSLAHLSEPTGSGHDNQPSATRRERTIDIYS